VEKVCKVEKLRSTFHTFHDYLNFYGEKKDDRLFTIYGKLQIRHLCHFSFLSYLNVFLFAVTLKKAAN